MLPYDALGRRSCEWRLPREHFVQHTPKGVDIAPAIEVSLTRGLLGRHVLRRADSEAGFCQAITTGGADGPSDPEIGDPCMSSAEQDVLGLDIPVDDIVLVREVERVRHFPRDLNGVVDGELLLAIQAVAQRLALDIRHDIEKKPVGLARIVERQDVRMFEAGGELDLAQEPLAADRGGQLGLEDLDRHRAVELSVLGQIDDGHSTTTQFPLDAVAVGEGGSEAF
jgi:hypothetical protein